MSTRFFDDAPEPRRRNICSAEPDAEPAGGGAPPPDNIPEIILDDDATSGADGADDDTAELEIGPAKHKVPKPVKEAWAGLQKSTQAEKEAVAVEKKAVAAERERQAETLRTAAVYMRELGRIQSIDEQLADYDKLTMADWMTWAGQDQDAVNKAQTAMAVLKAERTKLKESIGEKERTVRADRDRQQAEAATRAETEIAAKIKDWSPEKKQELVKLAGDAGVPQELIDFALKVPAFVTLMDEVRQFRAAKARAKAAAEKAKTEQDEAPPPEPVTRTRGTGGAAVALGDNVNMDTWVKNFTKVYNPGRPR